VSYYRFTDDDGNEYGSFETFRIDAFALFEGESLAIGWYWQAGFPGCLPDGEPCGPFDTEQAAIDDAQEN
jgi:hypothetical protein